ncbi:MAG: hypothetical protein ACOY0T_18855 [Myxococcota bacterium]
MPLPRLPKNDGWTDVVYDLGESADDNTRISAILNEACHVFRHHSQGTWASHDRDAYAGLLVEELQNRPGLAGRLLATDDRVVKMITYRALEMLNHPKTVSG